MKSIITLLFLFSISITINAQEIFEIKFTAGLTQHRCALIIFESGNAIMRVRYFSNGKTEMVEQTMKIEDTKYGIRITGYDPVYSGTSIEHPSYNADNFYLSMDEYGEYELLNVDDGGMSAQAYVRKIEFSKDAFLSDFNWKL